MDDTAAANRRIARSLKALAERALGIHIARAPAAPLNKHADHAIRGLRRWSPQDVVFDVGANDGRTILRIHEQLSRPRIFAFEPVPSTYRALVERTSHLPNVRTFPVALGAASGREPMYLNPIDAMNSFSPGWTEAPTGVEVVEMRTVDQVMRAEDVPFVHFLKVDTEGYELEVLKGAEGALRSSRVAIIQLEVGVGQIAKEFLPLERARCYLAQWGYLLYGVYNQCRTRAQAPAEWPAGEAAGYNAQALAYCDALFIRADL